MMIPTRSCRVTYVCLILRQQRNPWYANYSVMNFEALLLWFFWFFIHKDMIKCWYTLLFTFCVRIIFQNKTQWNVNVDCRLDIYILFFFRRVAFDKITNFSCLLKCGYFKFKRCHTDNFNSVRTFQQANFARWEPTHGNFNFGHPWKQYLKIGAAMRNCACCVESLSSCMNSEIQVKN